MNLPLEPIEKASVDELRALQLQRLKADFGEIDFFCINDTTDDAHAQDPRLKKIQALLQSMLAQPSAFERSPDLTSAAPDLLLAG